MSKRGATFQAGVGILGMRASGATELLKAAFTFRRVGAQEAKALRALPDAEALRRVLVAWDLHDQTTGEVIPFTPETFAEYCAIAGAPALAMKAYWAEVR